MIVFCGCYESVSTFLGGLSTANWIDIISILVDVLIACWITYFISRRISADRELRNYFMTEVKNFKQRYIDYLNKVASGTVTVHEAICFGKNASMELSEFQRNLINRYGVPESFFKDMKYLAKNKILNYSWNNQPSEENTIIKLTASEENDLNRKKKVIISHFNDIIIKING